MNVKSTRALNTAVSCSVATSSSESLPNDGENPNQPKRPLFPKWDQLQPCQRSAKVVIHKSQYTGRMVVLRKLVDSVSIKPVLSTIKLLS